MPRFKTPAYGLKMTPVDFDRQVIPGSFEHALCHLIDHEIDLAPLVACCHNDNQRCLGLRVSCTASASADQDCLPENRVFLHRR